MRLKYFKQTEFDSPDLKGSGENMNSEFLQKLDKARELANTPFVITSGYRTPDYNQLLIDEGIKASPVSSHMKGLAADISAKTSRQKYDIVTALMSVGFNRIGIASSFVHVDDDIDKVGRLIWTY